jgi:hypothetical protein
MSEYSVEEVRAQAASFARVFDGPTCTMLTAYADLREQIQRAREGVTDEIVRLAEKALFDNRLLPTWSDTVRIALQSAAHLLPSGERGGVDESAEVRLGEYLKSQAGYACLNDQSRRNIANTFLAVAYPTHPPAQVAQVVELAPDEMPGDKARWAATCSRMLANPPQDAAEPVEQGDA